MGPHTYVASLVQELFSLYDNIDDVIFTLFDFIHSYSVVCHKD